MKGRWKRRESKKHDSFLGRCNNKRVYILEIYFASHSSQEKKGKN
jgi:hypothetical protein